MVLQQNKIEVNFEIAGDNKVYLQAEANPTCFKKMTPKKTYFVTY
jgi:hypothetical protein